MSRSRVPKQPSGPVATTGKETGALGTWRPTRQDEELQVEALSLPTFGWDFFSGGDKPRNQRPPGSRNLGKLKRPSLGPGRPLDARSQRELGARFDADLSDVRVHTDDAADRETKSRAAHAFTHGPDIAFRRGAYNPESRHGRGLLAHEVVHFVQQRRRVRSSLADQERAARRGVAPRSTNSARLVNFQPPVQRQGESFERVSIIGSRFIVETDAPSDATFEIPVQGNLPTGSYQLWWNGDDWIIETLSGDPVSPGYKFAVGPIPSDLNERFWTLMTDHAAAIPLTVNHGGVETETGENEPEGSGEGFDATTIPQEPLPGIPSVRVDSQEQLEALLALGVEIPDSLTASQSTEEEIEVSFEEAQGLLQSIAELVAEHESDDEALEPGAWVRLGRFIQQNRDFLSGEWTTGTDGPLSVAQLQNILSEFGRVVGMESLITPLEPELVGSYDPEVAESWHELSSAEQEIWRQFRAVSTALASGDGTFEMNARVRRRMAIALSWQYVEGGAQEAIRALVEDPIFQGSVVAAIAAYIALWLFPEPVFSKSVVIALTAALLTFFTALEIRAFALAWGHLTDQTRDAIDFAQIEQASENFGRELGGIAGRVLITLAMLIGGALLPTPRPIVPGGGSGGLVAAGAGGGTISTSVAGIQVLADGTVVILAPLMGGSVLFSSRENGSSETDAAQSESTTETTGGSSGQRGELTVLDNPEGYSASELYAANELAANGRNVVLRPPSGARAAGGTSDLLVDSRPWDVYTPRTSNPDRIISALAKKNDQAVGLVLDLRSTVVTEADLGNILRRLHGAGATNIEEVFVIRGP